MVNKNLLFVGIMTMLLIMAIMPKSASAEPSYTISLIDGSTVLGTNIDQPTNNIPFGTDLITRFETNDTDIGAVIVLWNDPDNSTVYINSVNPNGTVSSFDSEYIPTQNGNWTVRVMAYTVEEFNANGISMNGGFNPNFASELELHFTIGHLFVIPESPIGSIALIITSLGIAGYVIHIRSKKNYVSSE